MCEFDYNYTRNKSIQSKKPHCIQRFPHAHGRKRLYTTQSPQELLEFVKDFDLLMSYKLAGQPVTLTYEKGKLKFADICNDGTTGYDITDSIKKLTGVPDQIPNPGFHQIHGTLIIPWATYNKLIEVEKYTARGNNPWKLIRLLTLNLKPQEFANINPLFIAYDIGGLIEYEKKSDILTELQELGFQVTKYTYIKKSLTMLQLNDLQAYYTPYSNEYPISGIVLETDQLPVNCFDPNARRIIALDWPYVQSTEFIGIQRLLTDLKFS